MLTHLCRIRTSAVGSSRQKRGISVDGKDKALSPFVERRQLATQFAAGVAPLNGRLCHPGLAFALPCSYGLDGMVEVILDDSMVVPEDRRRFPNPLELVVRQTVAGSVVLLAPFAQALVLMRHLHVGIPILMQVHYGYTLITCTVLACGCGADNFILGVKQAELTCEQSPSGLRSTGFFFIVLGQGSASYGLRGPANL
eukprot:Gb_22992 [translate_table: standard]